MVQTLDHALGRDQKFYEDEPQVDLKDILEQNIILINVKKRPWNRDGEKTEYAIIAFKKTMPELEEDPEQVFTCKVGGVAVMNTINDLIDNIKFPNEITTRITTRTGSGGTYYTFV